MVAYSFSVLFFQKTKKRKKKEGKPIIWVNRLNSEIAQKVVEI
jgi:hypothetical protein